MHGVVAGAIAAVGLVMGNSPMAAADTTEFRIAEISSQDTYNWLSRVIATGPANAWAFGETTPDGAGATPVARHWDGRSWTDIALPAGLERGISDAAASGPSNVWAFGGGDERGDAYALRWNGHRWSVAHRWPAGLMVSDAVVLSPRDVWVFGTSHIGPGIGTWHFDGRTWSQVETPPAFLRRASAVSADDIWAIGTNAWGDADDLLARWNGTTWTGVEIPGLPQEENHRASFNGIYAASSSDVWIVGDEYRSDDENTTAAPLVLHFDGSTWQRVDPSVADVGALGNVAPDGRGGIWVIPETGEPYQQPELLRYTQGRWTAFRPQRVDGQVLRIRGVTTVPRSTSTWAVGEMFPPDRATSDAAIWVSGPMPR
jgi:hypothetical protein